MDPMKFEKDIDWAMRSTRLLLSPLGLWPTKSKVYRKLVRPVALALCLFAMLFVTIPLCLFVILVAKDLKIRLKLIGSLSFGLMSLCKYAVMIYKEGTMAECICSMSLDWRALRDAAEYKIMTSNAKTGRLLVVACVIFVYGGGMPCVAVLPLFERSTLLVNESLRPLPYPSYFVLFDPQDYENRETVASITYSLLLVSCVLNIFMLCYVGEILTEQCESIGYAAYVTDWYRLPRRQAKNLVLLIATTQCPVYLTAGKMFNLSILSFSNLIKAAASYLEILRTVITVLI
ncbi:uncharacterized protein LOC131672506 [Phymastichus coffea]|uniref:uncharacterized protein LOC131672506 n=1 Tax=Phymastichus coffea TaxID=108790 RepID=UPI00273B88E2|nr:uncharacterized protein LOC131672506 [Phymastichus coffea]